MIKTLGEKDQGTVYKSEYVTTVNDVSDDL